LRARVAVAALAAFLAAAGAAVAAVGSRTADPPVVFAAASLTEVLPRVDAEARYSFGGSNQLAQQIRQGAPADVFLSANVKYADDLYRSGLVRKPVPFATNTLVVIVPKANPASIHSIGDLARRPKLRLVVGTPAVPIGLYTRKVLQRLALLRVLRKAVSLEPDVKGVVAKVALGEADAGFVYATDARPVAAKVRVLRIPARAQPRVLYEAAIVAGSARLDAAQQLLIELLGPGGRRQLRAAGFGVP
jgi:molybdate transport system substrate-binding protein